ncbi:MAG: 1-acyl-sn-glycerol-3-phosphate acyltransferase [Saprospiraceae bacterium]|nr:1-acyl-sn-glycerol-3-phosphate acyltransferase [Saprospiraceae bacterium]
MQNEPEPSIYSDEEAKAAIQELFGFQSLLQGMKAFLPPALNELILKAKDQVKSVGDFQEKIAYPLFKVIEKDSISKLTSSGLEHLDPSAKYLFISNHRDIILDSAFLNVVLFERGFRTSQIAIGDNLMRHRISELIFHINKSFVVKRSGTPMELYRYAVKLSDYIWRQITQKIDSVWIAQREGRAKDGDDRTQVGLVKMLSLSAKTDLKTYFREMKVVPVAISYEHDPCDLLKAQEFLNKRANPSFKKTFEEDVQHMLLGLKGYKGAVHFHFSAPFDAELDAFDAIPSAKKQLELLAEMIDQRIHQHYKLRPINYVAQDLLTKTDAFRNYYSAEEHARLSAFFEERFKLLTDDEEGLGREYLLGMYANPLVNQLAAMEL